MKNTSLFYIVLHGTSVKSCKIELSVFLFLVLHQFLYQQVSFLQLSRISFSIIWKRFLSRIFLFTGFTPSPQPHPINGQNLLKRDERFLSIFPKILWKFFFQNLLTKACKAFFLKASTTDSLVFFSEHISGTAILAKVSVITCK